MKNTKVIVTMSLIFLLTACGEKSDGNQNSLNSDKDNIALSEEKSPTKQEIENFENMGLCMGSVSKGMIDGVDFARIETQHIKDIAIITKKRNILENYAPKIDECSAKIKSKKDWISVKEENAAMRTCVSNEIPNLLDRAFMLNYMIGFTTTATQPDIDQKILNIGLVCVDLSSSDKAKTN